MKEVSRKMRRMAGMMSARLPEIGLEHVSDARSARGVRWELPPLLMAPLVAMAAGLKSFSDTEKLTEEVSADAGSCSEENRRYVTSKGLHYIFGLKGSQPTLQDEARAVSNSHSTKRRNPHDPVEGHPPLGLQYFDICAGNRTGRSARTNGGHRRNMKSRSGSN